MKTAPKPRTTTSKSRVAAHRRKLRAQGMRPIQIWVPDTRSPEFRAELRRQMRRIARSKQEKDDQAFVDSHVEEMLRDIAREEG
jgi:electron transfer flavoprotein alpha/beta subunit